MKSLEKEDQAELHNTISDTQHSDAERIARVRALYEKANVFEQANRLVEKHQAKAEQIADEIEPLELRGLFYYLIDTVLERSTDEVKPTINVIEPGSIEDLTAILK